ncbi:hypothetical protein PanWU01x14_111080 [Parasponia andersonii]|uniref:Uncharacterized protein n=1 Tax=Parasponia andersonii TaxID=3476 RepID=A0A2P5CYW5_PARAD|nr:hypothetical protein PanWU01x14_111080 [Parasponia andersonii]
MGFKGDQYTWWNKQYGTSSVMERLDRILCTLNCCTMFSMLLSTTLFVKIGSLKDFDKLHSELGLIRRNLSLPDAAERLKVTEDKINKILQDQEIYWKQRLRASWLKWGDHNTRFFHCKASQRKSRNKIRGLIDNNGIWRDEKREIEAVVVDYFQTIFTTEVVEPQEQHAVLDSVEPIITNDVNEALVKEFSASELAQALHQMHPTKAPGPGGICPPSSIRNIGIS